MPRTKRPAAKKDKPIEDEEAKKFDRLVLELKNKIDLKAEMKIRSVELAYKILVGSISSTMLTKTVGELKTELHVKETTKGRTRNSSHSVSHDDGYLTENSSQGSGDKAKKMGLPSSTTSKTVRRSRSADASSRKITQTITKTQRRRSKSVYKTPAYNRGAVNCYPAITPKVTPHTSVTLLRQPRQGEMVVSMAGSPVMMSSCNNLQSDEKANCNIRLQDGTMLSLQPKTLRQSQAYIPFTLMDNQVLSQLRTLKENLDKVVKLGERVIEK